MSQRPRYVSALLFFQKDAVFPLLLWCKKGIFVLRLVKTVAMTLFNTPYVCPQKSFGGIVFINSEHRATTQKSNTK